MSVPAEGLPELDDGPSLAWGEEELPELVSAEGPELPADPSPIAPELPADPSPSSSLAAHRSTPAGGADAPAEGLPELDDVPSGEASPDAPPPPSLWSSGSSAGS